MRFLKDWMWSREKDSLILNNWPVEMPLTEVKTSVTQKVGIEDPRGSPHLDTQRGGVESSVGERPGFKV